MKGPLTMCWSFFPISGASGVSRISFRGGVQNISGKLGVLNACREAPCSAWRSHAFVRGVRGHVLPRKFFKNGAIWCVLENILLKFCQKNNLKK